MKSEKMLEIVHETKLEFYKKYILFFSASILKEYFNGIFILLAEIFFKIYFCLKVQETK